MLLLIAIKHAVHNQQYRITFSEIEQDLKYLLQKYGLPRTVIHPEHPFWRLRNDGFWIVENAHQRAENSAGDVGRNQLVQKEIRAGFTDEVLDQLINGSRYTYKDLVLSLLDQYFPESLHSDILNDIGIRHALLGYREADIGGILENIVFLELKRRGYSVSIGKLGDREVDFIATRQNEKIYIQVAYLLASPETIEREFGILKSIPDNYPKYVPSLDTLFGENFDGIQRINLIDFLLSEI